MALPLVRRQIVAWTALAVLGALAACSAATTGDVQAGLQATTLPKVIINGSVPPGSASLPALPSLPTVPGSVSTSSTDPASITLPAAPATTQTAPAPPPTTATTAMSTTQTTVPTTQQAQPRITMFDAYNGDRNVQCTVPGQEVALATVKWSSTGADRAWVAVGQVDDASTDPYPPADPAPRAPNVASFNVSVPCAGAASKKTTLTVKNSAGVKANAYITWSVHSV